MTYDGIEIEKVPSLTCNKCGSFRVMMTDDGPECSDCETSGRAPNVPLSAEVEYLIYQLNLKEMETDEAFGSIQDCKDVDQE